MSCRSQYDTWERGPGPAADTKLREAVRAVEAAARSRNAAALNSTMSKLMPLAWSAAGIGRVPFCADPSVLSGAYIIGAYEAGYAARSAHGLAGLLAATAALKDLPRIQSELTAEIRRAVPTG